MSLFSTLFSSIMHNLSWEITAMYCYTFKSYFPSTRDGNGNTVSFFATEVSKLFLKIEKSDALPNQLGN